ncbi:MAG: element excision factor XisI family protein [Aggregatilineales bacterium]
MDTATIKQILLEELQKYAGKGLNADSYLTKDETAQVYTIVDIADVRGQRIIGTVLLVRLQQSQIVIELDNNSKPLIDALLARGVPEAQVIPAYQDTTIPA